MKFVLAVFGVLVTAVLLLAGFGIAAVFDSAPAIAERPPLTAADLEAVRGLLRQVDPRNKVAGSLTELTLREADIEQSLNYGLDRFRLGSARFDIANGATAFQFSVPLALAWFTPYLNADVTLVQQGGGLRVQHMRVGRIDLPPSVGDRILSAVHADLQQRLPDYAAVIAAVDHFDIGNDELTLGYRWQPQLFDQLSARGRELLLSPDLQERLQAHARRLAQLSRNPLLPARTSLTTLLAPMLQFASERGGDAREENRAALQVLALYIMNVDQRLLLGDDPDGRPQRHQLQLAGRRDYAQHFLLSAALAVTTDAALTQQMGLLKELQDAEAGGSGFSFTDLAVDRAGARFGELAVASASEAQRVQQALAADTAAEALLLPDLRNLPEFMPAAEFEQRFTSVGSPAWNAVADDIEQRLKALPLFSVPE